MRGNCRPKQELLASYLGSQALTAARAATLEDIATILGGHAGAKAVATAALGSTRLISSFHNAKPCE